MMLPNGNRKDGTVACHKFRDEFFKKGIQRVKADSFSRKGKTGHG